MKKLFLPVIVWLFYVLLLAVIPCIIAYFSMIIGVILSIMGLPIGSLFINIFTFFASEQFIYMDSIFLAFISFFCLLWFILNLVDLYINKEYFFPKKEVDKEHEETKDYNRNKNIILEG